MVRGARLRPLQSVVPNEQSALSLGERVDRDGAFTSRRGPGEGLLRRPQRHAEAVMSSHAIKSKRVLGGFLLCGLCDFVFGFA